MFGGMKIHQQVRKGITKCEPALKTAIQKFNTYCNTLQDLIGDFNIPTPHHLPTKLSALWEDSSLMEDVWIHLVSETPLWLTELSVHNGICAMLKIDWCEEEQKQLGIEADSICAWFRHELVAVTIALYSPDSKLDPSYLLLHIYLSLVF